MINETNVALMKDINKMYLEAVQHYENFVNSPSTNIESFANLSFLYWAFAFQQIEFNIPNNIPDSWSIIGGERYLAILDKGLMQYPRSLELNFWRRYFSSVYAEYDFSEDECIDMIKEYGKDESLVPYFYLSLFNKKKHRYCVSKLLADCMRRPTAKNIYIKSFLN